MPFDGVNFKQQDDVLDLLRRARDRVAAPDGWYQGWFENRSGGRCALGQLCEDGIFNFPVGSNKSIAVGYLEAALNYGAEGVAQWQDDLQRQQSEIVALYDRAIAKREAELQSERMKA